MSKKIKDFIKIVAALLAVVAVVGLLGSFISDRKGDEDPTDSESVKFEETTEEVIVDHSKCENEHNWSLRLAQDDSYRVTDYSYICGVCNTPILVHTGMGQGIEYGSFYGAVDLSTAHRFSAASGITSHLNYNYTGTEIYISSEADGGKITTSFAECSVGEAAKYMIMKYRVHNDVSGDLTLTLDFNDNAYSSTVSSPFTDGWRIVIIDITGDNYDHGDRARSRVEVSFSHYATLDIAFIGFASTESSVQYIDGYNSPYYDLGSKFSNFPGDPVYVE